LAAEQGPAQDLLTSDDARRRGREVLHPDPEAREPAGRLGADPKQPVDPQAGPDDPAGGFPVGSVDLFDLLSAEGPERDGALGVAQLGERRDRRIDPAFDRLLPGEQLLTSDDQRGHGREAGR
jgi:hypothetical protein